METVYALLIISAAIVILVIAILLRDRITKIKLTISLKERRADAEIKAPLMSNATPRGSSSGRASQTQPKTGIVGNVLHWWSSIRAPEGAHIEENKLTGGSRIEIFPGTPPVDEENSGSSSRALS